jgi:hypothetical protein
MELRERHTRTYAKMRSFLTNHILEPTTMERTVDRAVYTFSSCGCVVLEDKVQGYLDLFVHQTHDGEYCEDSDHDVVLAATSYWQVGYVTEDAEAEARKDFNEWLDHLLTGWGYDGDRIRAEFLPPEFRVAESV